MKKNNVRIKKPVVVIDTNIFINSWFDDDADCNLIMDLLDDNKIKLLFSQDTIGELIYIVKNFSIKFMSSRISRIQLISKVAEIFCDARSVNTMETTCPNINDKYDEMFLKCAIKGKADFIISNDFKSGMHQLSDLGIKVVSAEEFINLFFNELSS